MRFYEKAAAAAALVIVFAFGFLPMAAQAFPVGSIGTCPDGSTPPPGVPCSAPIYTDISIYSILNSVISILFYVLMFFAVIMILMAAFNFVTAGGDEEKVAKARSAIVYAVIAIVIAVLARSIPFIVSTFVTSNVKPAAPSLFNIFVPGT